MDSETVPLNESFSDDFGPSTDETPSSPAPTESHESSQANSIPTSLGSLAVSQDLAAGSPSIANSDLPVSTPSVHLSASHTETSYTPAPTNIDSSDDIDGADDKVLIAATGFGCIVLVVLTVVCVWRYFRRKRIANEAGEHTNADEPLLVPAEFF
jgi:hypothetical protein